MTASAPAAMPPCAAAVGHQQPRLIDQLRAACLGRGHMIATFSTYKEWICRYIHFHGRRHPRELSTLLSRSRLGLRADRASRERGRGQFPENCSRPLFIPAGDFRLQIQDCRLEDKSFNLQS
jgi:hypothetical protein